MPGTPSTQPRWNRLTRRGFLAGATVVGASALVACSSTAANPTPTTGTTGTTPAATTAAASPTGAVVVKMTNQNRFSPDALDIPVGTTVTWDNVSSTVHSATFDPAKAANKKDAELPSGVSPWDSGLLQPGQKFSHTFKTPGLYKYFCIPHESLGMVGTVTVKG